MATQSYKERMRETRAEARAKRQAEKAEWRRHIELRAVVRRLSLDAAKATIRDRNDQVCNYSPAQLRVMADAFIGPWLVAQAKARIAERKTINTLSQHVTGASLLSARSR